MRLLSALLAAALLAACDDCSGGNAQPTDSGPHVSIPVFDAGFPTDSGPLEEDEAGQPIPVDSGINTEAVRVTLVNASSGPLQGGNRVQVSGFGLTPPDVDGAPTTHIFFGDNECTLQTGLNDLLTCTVPAGVTPGPVDVRAENPLGVGQLDDGYTYFAPLGLASIVPDVGSTEGGDAVTITGQSLAAGTVLLVGGRRAVDWAPAADGESATFTTPPGAPGRVDVEAVDAFGRALMPLAFTYRAPLALTSVDPAAIDVGTTPQIVLRGGGFTSSTTATIGGAAAAVLNLVDESRVVVRAPGGLTAGAHDVVVTDGAATARLDDALFVLTAPTGTPALTAVVPATGDALGGDDVLLVGEGLATTAAVTFGGAAATNVAVVDDRRVRATTPAGAAGAVDVVATTGTGALTAAGAFTYEARLGVASVDPPTGPVAGGTAVTIEGRGFAAGATVRIGGAAATNVVVVDADTITATTPAGSAGFVDVVVEQAGDRARGVFHYDEALTISTVTPTRGGMAGGTFVRVFGTGFTRNTNLAVIFGQIPADPADTVVVSDGVVTTRSPPNEPGTVDVAVVNLDGESAIAPRAYTYFDPTSLAGGTRGGPVQGAVYVTALDAQTRAPIPDAPVFAGTDALTPYVSKTDIFGQATLSGPDLYGPQTVTIAPFGYEYGTVVDVDASEITLYLFPLIGPPPQPASGFASCGDNVVNPPFEECDNGMRCDDTAEGDEGAECREHGCGLNEHCDDGFECAIDIAIPERRCKPMHCENGDVCREYQCARCYGGLADGAACTSNDECLGGTCLPDDAQCDPGFECLTGFDSLPRCKPMRCEDGAACNERACGICLGGPKDGGTCATNVDCQGGTCTSSHVKVCAQGDRRGQTCAEDTDCPGGGPCVDADRVCGAAEDCVDVAGELRCVESGAPACAGHGDGVCRHGQQDCEGIGSGACSQFGECDDLGGGLCLTRTTDGCSAIPAHGALGCDPNDPADLLCTQITQCRPGCEAELTIRGRVTGFAKELFDPALVGPNEIAVAFVTVTAPNELSNPPDPCQFNIVFEEGGTYFLPRARPERLAVVALAGIFDLNTGAFDLRQMGVRRNVVPEIGVPLVDQDIELTIPLTETVDFSLPDAPLDGPYDPYFSGPRVTRVLPALRFGGEGALVYTQGVSGTRSLAIGHLPDVPGEMLTFIAGAYTIDGDGLVTADGLASFVEGDRNVTGSGTQWDITDPDTGQVLVEGAIFWSTCDDGTPFASIVDTMFSGSSIFLTEPPPCSGSNREHIIGNPGDPSSQVIQDGVGALGGGVTIQPVLGLPESLEPAPMGALSDRQLRWKPATGQQPTLHMISAYEGINLAVYWTFYVDGQRSKVVIPELPDAIADLGIPALPTDLVPGAYVLAHQSLYIPGVDIAAWSFLDLGFGTRRSWTTDLHLFTVGGL